MEKVVDKEDFHQYVLEFYNGTTGIYKEVDATYLEVVDATKKLVALYAAYREGMKPYYDSVDRETVRDIILEGRK